MEPPREPPRSFKSDFNTLSFDKKTKEIKRTKTFFGKVYSQVTGKSLKTLSDKAIEQEMSKTLASLHDRAQKEGARPLKNNQVKHQILAQFDELRKVFLDLYGASHENLLQLGVERESLKRELRMESQIARPLASDLVEHLSLTEGFLSPITPLEENYINMTLARSPNHLKKITFFEQIQEKTVELTDNPKRLEMLKIQVKIGDKKYTVYDLDNKLAESLNYQFIGISGLLQNAVDDVHGCNEARWPLMSSSLIDAQHQFFQESSQRVFQVLAVPPEAIVTTFPTDVHAPYSGINTQEHWYGMAKRAKVLTDHVESAYHQFKTLQAQKDPASQELLTPISTPFDQMIRLRELSQERSQFLASLKENLGNDKGKIALIDLMLTTLNDPKQRQNPGEIQALIQDFRNNLVPQNLKERDLKELQDIILKIVKLENEFPQLKVRAFYEEPPAFEITRTKLQLAALKEFYGTVQMTEEQRKNEFRKLFLADDPSGVYDIVGELNKTEALIQQIPKIIPSDFDRPQAGLRFATNVNRFMGPQEVLSETPHDAHNELNLEAKRPGVLVIKALIIPRHVFEKGNQEDVKKLRDILNLAKKNHIPVFIRSVPGAGH